MGKRNWRGRDWLSFFASERIRWNSWSITARFKEQIYLLLIFFLHAGVVFSRAYARSSLSNHRWFQTFNWKGVAFLWTQVHPPWKSYRFNPGRIYSHLSSVLGLCASGILRDIGIIRWDLGYRAQSPFRSNVVKPHVSNHYSQSDVRKLSHVTRKLLEARENAGDQLAFGFSFESVWLWGWREFSEPITQWSREKQKQSRITFNTLFIIAVV